MSGIELPGKVEQVWKGGRACVDTSTGLVAKPFASTTLVPIGVYSDDQLTASGQTVHVLLEREIRCRWFANSTAGDAVTSADLLKDCYLTDDQTVAKTNGSSTRSVAGRVWKVANGQVLVEMPR